MVNSKNRGSLQWIWLYIHVYFLEKLLSKFFEQLCWFMYVLIVVILKKNWTLSNGIFIIIRLRD